MTNPPASAILTLPQLSASQHSQTEALAAACRQADSISLTYPSAEEDCRHYLLYAPDGQLLTALAVIPYENLQAECCAFTHPDHRRHGYFSALLERALDEWDEYEFTFYAEESCKDTCAVLKALGAELDHRELQMECRITRLNTISQPSNYSSPSGGMLLLRPTSAGQDPAGSPDENEDEAGGFSQLWTLTCASRPDRILGTCQTFPLSTESICLHHVEIPASLRGKGLGTALVRLLLADLAADGITHVLLHVSGDNIPAVALYKKTGFCITKTLSCFLY